MVIAVKVPQWGFLRWRTNSYPPGLTSSPQTSLSECPSVGRVDVSSIALCKSSARASCGCRAIHPLTKSKRFFALIDKNSLLVWIDPSRGRLALLHVIVLNAYGSGSEGLSATVDLSGIRGLGTDLSSLRRGATLVYKRGSLRPGRRRPHRRVRGSPTGPTLPEP